MNDRVRRVQELRRSNAAQPRPGKRRSDETPAWEEWAQMREGEREDDGYSPVCTHAEAHPWWRCPDLPCETCGTTSGEHTDELCFK